MKNREYVKRVVLIIFLTNLPAIFALFFFFKESIAWICGSLISAGNFFWMAGNARKSFGLEENKSKLNSTKGFFLRYFVLIIYSVIVVKFIKPNIIVFGMGLLAAQMAIYINEIYERVKRNKYFHKS